MKKKDLVIKMLAQNPDLGNGTIAKACKCTISYVYMLRNKMSAPSTGIDQVLAERGSRYGKFMGHAIITQQLKDVMREGLNWSRLDRDMAEALEMVAHKIGRILNGDPSHADSWVDIAGYAKLVADRLEGREV
jgi:hypothetical protein